MGNSAPIINFSGGDPLHREREAWSYGGGQNAADEAAARLDNRGDEWDRWLYSGKSPDMGQANAARGLGAAARQEELYGANAALAMARGGGPSVAGAELGAARTSSLLGQAAAMGGGGPQLAAMRQGGEVGMGLVGAYGQARGGEMANALGSYQGTMGTSRGLDYGQAGMDLDRQRGLSGLYHGQRDLNDEMSEFYRRKAFGARTAQMEAMARGHEVGRGQLLNRYAAGQAIRNENAQRNAGVASMAASMMSSFGTAAAGAAGKDK